MLEVVVVSCDLAGDVVEIVDLLGDIMALGGHCGDVVTSNCMSCNVVNPCT